MEIPASGFIAFRAFPRSVGTRNDSTEIRHRYRYRFFDLDFDFDFDSDSDSDSDNLVPTLLIVINLVPTLLRGNAYLVTNILTYRKIKVFGAYTYQESTLTCCCS